MKKILLALVILGSTAFSSFAQSSKDGGKFSIGVEGGLPLNGNVRSVFDYVIGGSLKYEIPVAQATFFTVSAGFNSFHAKSEFTNVSSANWIPLKVGIKHYFEKGFFGEAQLGASIPTVSERSTRFAYSPGIGYTFDGGFEAGVRYEGWSNNGTISQLGLRLAYRF
ncbi:hypothetical protein [Mucilaginibacter lappiensis]|jgi:hypothetical protein|uniref:hypothetical protein n=1 Tax=Mucilaginibacter lappiensis TaxID=354630 RepID=UPI003D1F453A